jgi:hypothetical protein
MGVTLTRIPSESVPDLDQVRALALAPYADAFGSDGR